jgi:hypothetical protein
MNFLLKVQDVDISCAHFFHVRYIVAGYSYEVDIFAHPASFEDTSGSALCESNG